MKCGQATCRNEAVWRVFWPGRNTVMCDRCFLKGQRIAEAMGFELQGEKLPRQE